MADRSPRLSMVTLGVRGGCNYECAYCVARNQIERTSVHSIEGLEDLLGRLPRPMVIELECGGAEPTLHPQIRGLLGAAAHHGVVSIPTNNSIEPERWMPRDGAAKLHLRAALHPEGEDDLDGFLGRLLRARGLGAQVEVGFIAHPTRVSRVAEHAARFAGHGIPFHVRPFMGTYDGKRYPVSHTRAELARMSPYHRLYSAIDNRDFHGISCIAGHRTFFVNPQGGLQRCLYDAEILTAPLEGPTPCRVHQCCAGLLLEDLNMLDMFEEGSLLYRMAGLAPPSPDVPDAEAAVRRGFQVYASLMSASGKSIDDAPARGEGGPAVSLFDADAAELVRVLERNFYGPRPGGVIVDEGNAMEFRPASTSDHVATPFFDVLPREREGYSWLRLAFEFPGGAAPAKALMASLQDQAYVTLAGIVTPASIDPGADGRFVRFLQIPPDADRLRMIFQSEGNEAVALPSHLTIEHLC